MARNYSRQFMAWVTGSRNNLFLWARLKLTFFYMVFIALVLVSFSIGLYVVIDKNIRDSVGDKKKNNAARQYIIEQADIQLMEILIAGNVILLFFSGGLAFFLAGKNLIPIKQALEKQKRFAADASHDLRTPLAIMKTDCEISLKKQDISAEEFRELIKSNLEEVDRMSDMVEQLLFLSRNNGALELKKQAVSLGELAIATVNNFKNLAEAKKISLVVTEAANGNIDANLLEIEKMFLNILKNAIDYTPDGGRIAISVRRGQNGMSLSVKDTGIGISDKDLPNITEAFFKVDEARSGQTGGAGLGLSIVKRIVENCGGKLFIASKLNVGTEVSIIFPESSV